jgi:hypothetical protein
VASIVQRQQQAARRAETARCAREHRASWWVYQYRCNFSAFSGYHYTPSDYSGVCCAACGRRWRTKAAYVDGLPGMPPEGSDAQ